jgi:DNA-binding MarR family transcriptional regulator
MTSPDGGPALFRLVRFWSRRWARGIAAGDGDTASTAQHVLTVEAVTTCCARSGGDPDSATVGDVARRLGLDQSGASRMVAAAAAGGYVGRTRAATDARRSVLRLTPAGHALIDSSHRWQRDTFAELTATWDEKDRTQFAGYLQRLATELGA